MAMCKRLGRMASTALAVALLMAVSVPAFAAQPSEQQVRKLMDAIGLGRSLSQMNTQIATSMKQSLPCIASNYWQDFVDQAGSNEFIGRLVPVYQKHFSADEVDGMVKFYSSPLGQKVLTEMPAAMAEANQAGQQWSREHGQQMIAKLEQAGTLTSDGRCPATAGAAAASSTGLPAAGVVDADAGDDPAVLAPAADHVHGTAHPSHKHVPVKKKVPPKKPAASKTPTSKPTASKSATTKASSSKTPPNSKPQHTTPAPKPASSSGSAG